MHQEALPMQWLRQSLFSVNVKEVEEKYQIKVDPSTIPTPQQNLCISPTILIDTQSVIITGLRKKLAKTYQYQKEGFSNQGTLILAISDPLFEGFLNNLEMKFNNLNLENLQKMAETLAAKSCFNRVLLVDSLAPFHENPENYTYELLKRK